MFSSSVFISDPQVFCFIDTMKYCSCDRCSFPTPTIVGNCYYCKGPITDLTANMAVTSDLGLLCGDCDLVFETEREEAYNQFEQYRILQDGN